MKGAVNELMGCRRWDVGQCSSTTADYCQDGTDFKCPLGYKRKSGYDKKTKDGSCEQCPAGEYCSYLGSNSCPDGYVCLEQTKDGKQNPAPEGTMIPAAGANTGASDFGLSFCEKGYCPPATKEGSSSTFFGQCHPGYTVNKTGGIDRTICEPTIPSYSAATTSDVSYVTSGLCADGSYCPLGSGTPAGSPDLTQKCHPGTRGSGTGRQNVDECEACPGDSFCAEGTTSGSSSNS